MLTKQRVIVADLENHAIVDVEHGKHMYMLNVTNGPQARRK